MARSSLTLAAAVSSALPGVGVSGVATLTAGGAGRCDAAIVALTDGRRVVVRAPVDEDAARELAAEALALRALTPGVRGLLGFRAPELLGEAGLGDARAIVTDLLPGYRVDGAYVPPGEGAATSIGRALASVHALPHQVARAEGLPHRSPEETRVDVRALIDRAGATGRLPVRLTARWRDAADSDEIWRFEATVVLGGAQASSFLLEDGDDGPRVVGMLEWHGLAVGDPAVDLRWLASAPDAAADVHAAYAAAAERAPDAYVQTRARMYAELEFARWLVHGHETHRPEVVADASALLDALAEGVDPGGLRGAEEGTDVNEALAVLDLVPPRTSAGTEVDTSMQTDAYDPDMVSLFVDSQREQAVAAPADTTDASTAPIDISAWIDAHAQPAGAPADVEPGEEAEADRAARATIHRWASSASE